MNDPVNFHVPGKPVPQGSKKGFVVPGTNRVSLVEVAGDHLKSWRRAIRTAALEAMGERDPLDEPVGVIAQFTFVRPKSHLLVSGAVAKGKPSRPGKPDLDKLCRALLDGMTGSAFVDDSQVAILHAWKEYGESGGVTVRFSPLPTDGPGLF